MTVNNGYATLDELRGNLGFSAANTASDTRLERLLETGSRMAENVCRGRRFYGVAETRYYTAQETGELDVDDLTSVTSLKTDEDGDGVYETTWSASDFNLKYGDNYNAALDNKPYTQIEVSESSSQEFPVKIKKGVLVSGVFGYVPGTQSSSARPQPISDAVLLAAERVFKRKDAPLGVMGNPALGQQTVRITDMLNDPDIMVLLDPYIKRR